MSEELYTIQNVKTKALEVALALSIRCLDDADTLIANAIKIERYLLSK